MFLFLFLFIHVLINCNLYTWQLLHTWPVEKAGNFPFQKGKKEILKNFPKYKSIVYNKLLIDSKRLLWYIFLFLTEHNPSFTLFLICSYFFTQSELRCSYKVCSYKKRIVTLLSLVFSNEIINGYWMKFVAINAVTDLKEYLFCFLKKD